MADHPAAALRLVDSINGVSRQGFLCLMAIVCVCMGGGERMRSRSECRAGGGGIRPCSRKGAHYLSLHRAIIPLANRYAGPCSLQLLVRLRNP